jgi:two-component system sensor histidine kinase KdpD
MLHQRESEMRALYAFSRELAVASGSREIYAAIQDHLRQVLGRRVVLFEGLPGPQRLGAQPTGDQVPAVVHGAITDILESAAENESVIVDPDTETSWLIRAVSQKTPALGIVAIDLGDVSKNELGAIRQRVRSVLSDATATLDRLDVVRAIGDAKVRAEAETFRDAIIGSVSHELRTPLASIIGSTYILANAPGVKEDARLAALADDVHHEIERLNDDIQIFSTPAVSREPGYDLSCNGPMRPTS